jgi:hypothetical protein
MEGLAVLAPYVTPVVLLKDIPKPRHMYYINNLRFY